MAFPHKGENLLLASRSPPAAANVLIFLESPFDSHFLGFRHAGYYLPGYLTVEYPEVKLPEGTRVFVMHQRDTRMAANLPLAAYSRFVLFPLPGGSGFREYLKKVQARVPGESLRTIRLGKNDFITDPISDLPLLFPDAASAQQSIFPDGAKEHAALNADIPSKVGVPGTRSLRAGVKRMAAQNCFVLTPVSGKLR